MSLESFQKKHDFLVGIDSDGCAFDSMEVKHKECFIPNTIKYFDLQAVSKYARESAEFVNLYSKWRGINRFPALINTIDLLLDREDVTRRGVKLHELKSVREWIAREKKLANPALEAEVQKTGDADLKRTLEWSKAVNKTVDDLVHGVPPFPYVRESLELMAPVADMIVCSATPGAALQKEWDEHGIAKYIAAICGQEVGTKKDILGQAMKAGYKPTQVLMIGMLPATCRRRRLWGHSSIPSIRALEEQAGSGSRAKPSKSSGSESMRVRTKRL
ncbi:MAG: HAD family hydrolase [Planctomycetales bacterium]